MKIKIDENTKAVDVLRKMGTMLCTRGNTYLFLPQLFKEVKDGVIEEVTDKSEILDLLGKVSFLKLSQTASIGDIESKTENLSKASWNPRK